MKVPTGEKSLLCLYVKTTLDCPFCGKQLPVNRAEEQTLCRSCFRPVKTPSGMWQRLIVPRLLESINADESEKNGSARGILHSTGPYTLEYGRRDPKCRNCGNSLNPELLLSTVKAGESFFACTECGEGFAVRTPPLWLTGIFPQVRLLTGEESVRAGEDNCSGDRGISLFCYHCGGVLPLDGSNRVVKCRYCGNDCMIPDDIWMRLHPVRMAREWDLLVDLAGGVAILPDTIDAFIDLAGLPGEDTALLWEGSSGCCLGRTDRNGIFRWLVKGLPLTSHARLFSVTDADLLWVMDPDREKDPVQIFDASTGTKTRVFGNKKKPADHYMATLDYESAAVCSDNTAVIYRRWGDGPNKERPIVFKKRLTGNDLEKLNARTGLWEMRRFDGEGKRIPLWNTLDTAVALHTIPSWETLADYPLNPPDDTLLEGGPDGTLYMIDTNSARFARFDREGRLLGIVCSKKSPVDEVEDCGIAGDGSLIILFNHRKLINGDTWSHVARISPDGAFLLLAGPFAPVHNKSFGRWVERISVTASGYLHLCDGGFDNLRVLNPDGSPLWKSPGTAAGGDSRLAEELDEALGRR